MVQLKYPAYAFNIRENSGVAEIFDPLRKRWVKLSSEEWVRQNMIQYLIQELHYPSALISIEKQIRLGSLKKRFDILVYDKNHAPFMLVECKATEVALTEEVLQQALRYHLSVPCPYIAISNGHYCHLFSTLGGQLQVLHQFPQFT